MAFHQNSLQRSASCYGSVSILDGVKFKVGEKFKPPKKVTLPVGWHQDDPSEVLNLTYDFILEKDVLAKCESERMAKEMENNRLKEEEMLMAAMTVSTSPTCTKTESSAQPVDNSKTSPIFANVSADILTPVTATSTNNTNHKTILTRGDSFNLKDFEGDTTTPFDLVELQSINDMDALKSLLQPELESTPVSEVSPVTSNISTISSESSEQQLINIHNSSNSGVPSTQLCGSHHRPDETVNFPSHLTQAAEHVHSTGSPNVTQTSNTPGFGQVLASRTHPSISYSAGHNNVLIDVGDSKPLFQQVALNTSTPALPGQPDMVLGCPVSKAVHLPPILGSGSNKLPPLQPVPPPIPPRTYKKAANTQNGGVHGSGLDVRKDITFRPPSSSSETTVCGEIPRNKFSPEPLSRGYTPPNMGQENVAINSQRQNSPESVKRRTAERRTRISSFDGVDTQGNDMRHHSSPLPPILNASNNTVYPGPPVSCLPDPLPTMSDSEKNFVASISSMGFPSARVARAVLRLGEKEREVIDFLILVEEFSASGYLGDSIEIALIEYDMDKEKSMKFLKAATTLGEFGFRNEDIYEALKKNSLDTEKALDCLMAI